MAHPATRKGTTIVAADEGVSTFMTTGSPAAAPEVRLRSGDPCAHTGPDSASTASAAAQPIRDGTGRFTDDNRGMKIVKALLFWSDTNGLKTRALC
jgi:hypothetical protein